MQSLSSFLFSNSIWDGYLKFILNFIKMIIYVVGRISIFWAIEVLGGIPFFLFVC